MTVAVPTRKLRIAILCCFAMPEPIASERGQFDDVFVSWVSDAVDARNARRPAERVAVDFVSFDVFANGEYPASLDDTDALIVTGSAASAYEDEPWIHKLAAFLKDVFETKPSVKIFGGCFGHQIVCQTLLAECGARVSKNPKGWEIGVHEVHIDPEFASFFPALEDDTISYQCLHQDIVELDAPLPENWLQMGSSAMCDVQGVFLPGRVLTYQGHPEFDRFISKWCTVAVKNAGLISDNERMTEFFELIDKDDVRTLAGEMALEFFLS